MLAAPSVRSQSDPLPLGAVPQVVVGAPAAAVIVVEPIVMTALPAPATEICGFELLDAGGVPPEVPPPKSLVEKSGPEPLAIRPCELPPTVR